MWLISTLEGTQKGWVMDVLSFRMRISCLPLAHVLISMRIGNEAANPQCAVMPTGANQRTLQRRGRFKAGSCFHLRGSFLYVGYESLCCTLLLLALVKWIDLAENVSYEMFCWLCCICCFCSFRKIRFVCIWHSPPPQ
jgi:hypothetical protein